MLEIAQYLITAVLALIVGYLLWRIKRERYDLVYYLIESQPFPLNEKIGRFFEISLVNSGNKPIKDISYKVSFTSGTPQNVQFSDTELLEDSVTNDNEVTCQIPLLNPKEQLKTTITAINDHKEFNVEVKARAEGVSARRGRVEDNLPQSMLSSFVIVFTISVLIATSIFVYSEYKQSQITELHTNVKDLLVTIETEGTTLEERMNEIETIIRQRAQGQPDTQQLIFRSLTSAGLTNLIPELMLKGEITYWQTGLYLTSAYARDKSNGHKYVRAMEEILDNSDIAPSSKGFIYYLLSHIERDRGQIEKSEFYLNSCREETPLMYDFLIERDRDFQINELQ